MMKHGRRDAGFDRRDANMSIHITLEKSDVGTIMILMLAMNLGRECHHGHAKGGRHGSMTSPEDACGLIAFDRVKFDGGIEMDR